MTEITSKNDTHDNMPIEKNSLQEAWEDVVLKNLPVKDLELVRPVVYQSWIKSKKMGLDPYSNNPPPALSGKDLEHLFKTNDSFIEIAKPVLQMIDILVGDTGFMTTLADKNGSLLVVLGKSMILKAAERNFYLPGCRRDIKHAGTNGIGLCLEIDRPIQLTGCEHYRVKHHDWTCSSAPIHGSKGNIVGAITLSGISGNQHKHTLALVSTAAETIQSELATRELNKEISRLHSVLSSIFESTAEGVIALDDNLRISDINRRALKMLNLKKTEVIGEDFAKTVKPDDLLITALNTNSYLTGTEISFNASTGDQLYICNIDPIRDTYGKDSGKLITLAEKQQVINMTKKIGGNYARYEFDSIKGDSEILKKQIELAQITAKTNSRVLLTGESGTGKELFAQAIHNYSNRHAGPFVAISCATIPKDLVESELFGYRPGAFTGARASGMLGKFELANHGTLFLDEINALPLDVQSKLLRVLQQNEINRLGDTRTISVNVRVIAATNTDLFTEVQTDNFREDLYYRINVVEIVVPPLRERQGDLDLLIEYFTEHISERMEMPKPTMTDEILEIMHAYHWPGNVRQLENCIERAVVLVQGGTIQKQHLPAQLLTEQTPISSTTTTLHDGYKKLIEAALKRCDGNASKAAKELKIARSTLYRKMEEFNISKQ
jgi:PAS domain S-box-containing protein